MSKSIDNDQLLTVREAAEYLKLRNGSTALLDKMRCYGGGPRYIKVNKLVRYRLSSLEKWLRDRERISTSDPGTPPKSETNRKWNKR